MAKVTIIPKQQRGPSLRGRVMIDTFRGVVRVRKWPKKRGPPKSEAQRFWVDWFKQANHLAKYADPLTQIAAIELTAGTGWYPRDVILKAMRGRLYWFTGPDGWRYYPMAAIGDISETLDVLAQTVGSILVRAGDRWRDAAPGLVGDVLTHQGVADPPIWLAPSAGGLDFKGALVTKTGNQLISNASWTAAIFNSEVYDTTLLHDNVTNPSRMTIPAGWARVRLAAGANWATNSSNSRILRFTKNGASFPGNAYRRQRAISASTGSIASPAVDCVEGDYFEFEVYQDRGGTLNLLGPNDSTYFAMERAT